MSKLATKKRRKKMYGKEVSGRVGTAPGRISGAVMHQATRSQQVETPGPVNEAAIRSLIDCLIGRTCETKEQAARLLARTSNVANRVLGEEPPSESNRDKSPFPSALIQNLEQHMAELQEILAQVGHQVSRLEVL
jgi:hypothetical protein